MDNRKSKAISFSLPAGLGLGGSNLWSLQIGQALTERGWTANVLIHRGFDNGPRLDMATWPSVHAINVPGAHPGRCWPWDLWRYVRVYRRVLPSIVVPNWSEGTYAACERLVKSRPRSIRVLGVVHGMNAEHRALAIRHESVIRKFIAVSEEIGSCLSNAMPHRTEDILVRSCPVVVPGHLDRNWQEAGPLRLVYAGRITNYEKKVSHLIPLAERLCAAGVSFFLDIYGDGGYMQTLWHEFQHASSGVRASVKIHGFVPPSEMSEIWRKADVCILVSDSEGSPLCVMEAMAQGAVPVATQVSGVAALIDNGKTGYSVPIGALNVMVEKINILHGDRRCLARMGRFAYEKMKREFNMDAYIGWFENLMESITSGMEKI